MSAQTARRPEVGLITADPTPTLLGLLEVVGIGSIVIDAEQTGLGPAQCAEAVHRLRGSGVAVGVRVPSLEADCLLTFANTGVDELVLPRVRTTAELEAAHRATRFPPVGERPRQVSPASRYGTRYEHVPVLSVLFETVDALDGVDEFVRHPLFQGGWIGPTDLVDDLQRHGRDESVDAAVQRIIDAVAGAGHRIGMPAPSAARAGDVHSRGADRAAIYWEREVALTLRTLHEAGEGPHGPAGR
ncbi:aldolase/citrate lyase family protein [Microbacterium sp. ASV81]|uniref:Aldolase/citrate lyase family protein n=1 Tax=Microbacterium capsulatum TaxID=3041921 RepID=A0ABU0XKJ1_9MICO|nr:aldolase/citrate lyase family protein [Microbacterium sp. ASV81]MDQ4214635.1 aldolase/citrate lyase family protein [Microbacterium sp. ASV81]